MTRAAVRCGVLSVDGCHTAEENEACFEHVRWSMQHGITADPAQYPGLTQESNFEEFQALLHKQGIHDCPAPCATLPETRCHTAIPGEACFEHTTWAMTAGHAIMLEWYPPALLKEGARFEDFQAWLHKIHHGDCQRPCEPETELLDEDDTFELLGKGVCRTASGSKGTYDEPVAATEAECRAACSATSTCVAYEWKERGQECERHSEAISGFEAEDRHVCYVRKTV